MKRVFLLAVFTIFSFTQAKAQDEDQDAKPTAKQNWLIEVNTGFGEASRSNTSFSLTSSDGNTSWGIGGEVGYFVADDLAIKLGLGYGDSNFSDSVFNIKVGAKYYIASKIPVALDLNGSTGNDFEPFWLGMQGGYAFFISDKVAIEPGLRYGLALNEPDTGIFDFNFDIFSVNIGFNIFL